MFVLKHNLIFTNDFIRHGHRLVWLWPSIRSTRSPQEETQTVSYNEDVFDFKLQEKFKQN